MVNFAPQAGWFLILRSSPRCAGLIRRSLISHDPIFFQFIRSGCQPFWIIFLLVLTNLALAAGPNPSLKLADPTLRQQAQRSGEVRVIVELEVDFPAEAVTGRLLTDSVRKERVRTVRDGLMQRLAPYRFKQLKQLSHFPYVLLKVDAAALDALLAHPQVKRIIEDRPSKFELVESVPLVGAPAAWAEGSTGSGQVIAILDTGIDSGHPFLAGKVVHQACFSTNAEEFQWTTLCPNGMEVDTESLNAAEPCSVNDTCPNETKSHDHGTHVAGIAAGSYVGIDGVAKSAEILAIQVGTEFPVSQCEEGATGPCIKPLLMDLLEALEYVYDQRDNFNIASVNMSVGDRVLHTAPCDDSVYTTLIDTLRSVNIVTVVSSGNDGYINGISAPACVSSAVSVGATTKLDTIPLNFIHEGEEKPYYSNSVSFLDLLAPGNNIQSSVPGGSFDWKNGTSMAAPHVAGAFAVLRSADPTATVDHLLAALVSSGTDVLDPRNGLSKPRIDVAAALAALTGSLSITPSSNLVSNGTEGQEFYPLSIDYTLRNLSESSIQIQVVSSADWITVSPIPSLLLAGESAVVTVEINHVASGLGAGEHFAEVDFTNITSGEESYSRSVMLSVNEIPEGTPSVPETPQVSSNTYVDRVWLAWEPVPGADSYQVYRCTTGNPTSCTEIGGTSEPVEGGPFDTHYNDTTALPGIQHYYRLKACNSEIGCSDFTGYKFGSRAQSSETAWKPTASDGVYGDRIRISWSSPGGLNIRAYRVYRCTTTAKDSCEFVTENTYINADDFSALPGATYYYRLDPCTIIADETLCAGISEYDSGYRNDTGVTDTDADGLDDIWETEHFGNLNQLDSGDPDADNLNNVAEFDAGTDPNDADSDGDTLPDGYEIAHDLDPLVDDASLDPDADNLNNVAEFDAGTDPNDGDSDDDGLPDGYEIDHNLDPLLDDAAGDADADGFSNLQEFEAGTDPNDAASLPIGELRYSPAVDLLLLLP